MLKPFRWAGVAIAVTALVVTTTPAIADEQEPVSVEATPSAEAIKPGGYPGGTSEADYLAMTVDEQLALKLADEGPAPSAGTPGLIPKELVKFNEAISLVSDRIYALGNEYADVFTSYSVDNESQSIAIAISAAAAPDRTSEFKSKIADVLAPYTYPVEFPERGYALAPLQKVSDELTTDFKTWEPRFGGGSYYSFPDMEGDGVVRVFTSGTPQKEWRDFELGGVRVVVRSEGPAAVVGLSRLVDTTPHFGGIRLNATAGSTLCTAGFTWIQWGSSTPLGSTGEHCTRDTGLTQFFNGGTLVGVRTLTNYGYQGDTQLLTAAGHTWLPRVYVGLNSANTSFPVAGASSRPLGAAIALHASVSTPVVTTVAESLGSIYYESEVMAGYTIYGLVMTWAGYGPHCFGGDSGGPLITDNGAGRAYAHGQLVGYVTKYGYQYCTYVDINTISAALQSSVALSP